MTALMAATWQSRIDTVQTLLEAKANLNDKDNHSRTALMWAIIYNRGKIMQVLLNKGADVNATTNAGVTTLMLAAAGGHTEIVQALLNKGVDVNAKALMGEIALMLEREKTLRGITVFGDTDQLKGTKAFRQTRRKTPNRGVSFMDRDITAFSNSTPFGVIDLNTAKSFQGITALMLAKEKGHHQIVELLEKAGARE